MNKQQIYAVILMGVGLVVGTFLIYQNQKLRLKEGNREKLGSLVVQKGDNFGDVKTFNIVVSTGDLNSGESVPVSSISVKLKVGDKGEKMAFVNERQEPFRKVVPAEKIADDGKWLFPVNTIYEEDGQNYVEFVAVTTDISGYSTLTPMKLGTIYVKTSSVNFPVVEVLKEYTKLMSKVKPVVNILP